jgi:hypothetical protein
MIEFPILKTPYFQILVAELGLRVVYGLPRKTEIVIDGIENISKNNSVLITMEDLDFKKVVTFLYGLYKYGGTRYSAVWVGENYFSTLIKTNIFKFSNVIPIKTRGSILINEFYKYQKRKPTPVEMRILFQIIDGQEKIDEIPPTITTLLTEKAKSAKTRISDFKIWMDSVYEPYFEKLCKYHEKVMWENNLNVLSFLKWGDAYNCSFYDSTLVTRISSKLKVPVIPVNSKGVDQLQLGKGDRIYFKAGEAIPPITGMFDKKTIVEKTLDLNNLFKNLI